MFNLIKKLFQGKEKVSQQPRESEEPQLKWPSPIAQKVLDDLDKKSFWDWEWATEDGKYTMFSHDRKSPDGSYELSYDGSISNLELSKLDKDAIKRKIQEQGEIMSKQYRIEKTKSQLDKMGIDFEEVKQFLDIEN